MYTGGSIGIYSMHDPTFIGLVNLPAELTHIPVDQFSIREMKNGDDSKAILLQLCVTIQKYLYFMWGYLYSYNMPYIVFHEFSEFQQASFSDDTHGYLLSMYGF